MLVWKEGGWPGDPRQVGGVLRSVATQLQEDHRWRGLDCNNYGRGLYSHHRRGPRRDETMLAGCVAAHLIYTEVSPVGERRRSVWRRRARSGAQARKPRQPRAHCACATHAAPPRPFSYGSSYQSGLTSSSPKCRYHREETGPELSPEQREPLARARTDSTTSEIEGAVRMQMRGNAAGAKNSGLPALAGCARASGRAEAADLSDKRASRRAAGGAQLGQPAGQAQTREAEVEAVSLSFRPFAIRLTGTRPDNCRFGRDGVDRGFDEHASGSGQRQRAVPHAPPPAPALTPPVIL